VEVVEASEDAVVDLLLPGMCAIAAADGVLQASERKMIVDLIREKGCSMEQDVLEEKVVDTCRRIHKNGLQSAVEQLCQTLSPFIGRPLCELFLDLLDRIAAADGRVGNRESVVLEFFKRRLAAT
jgi:tellurite resistance protein